MTEKRRALVAVVGDAGAALDSASALLARKLGGRLVDGGYRVLTGGLGGVMEAACEGARRSRGYRSGDTVGVLPGHDPAEASAYVDIIIPTGLDVARNSIVAHADAVVAIGGGAGTLSEIAVAWMLKRLILAFPVDGWSGRLADTRIDDRVRYEEIPEDRVYKVQTPAEAIELLDRLLPRYQGSHRGVRRRA
jgi:hypothetical protein